MNQTDNHKAGVFKGNIDWPGTVHLAVGAEVVIDSKVSCREIEVAGKISGSGQNVVLETGMLRMRESATVEVGLLSLPPGGFEQARGAVVNANLRMTKEHPYGSQQPLPVQSKPVLAVVSSEASAAGRQQIPAFLTTAGHDAAGRRPGALAGHRHRPALISSRKSGL